MGEGQDKHLPPWLDESVIEAVGELSPELLERASIILAEVEGVAGEQEEKQINELLDKYNERLNKLIDQKRREKL